MEAEDKAAPADEAAGSVVACADGLQSSLTLADEEPPSAAGGRDGERPSSQAEDQVAEANCEDEAAVGAPASGDISYVQYESELQMPDIMKLIQKDLSEPYSIYTYRYFIHNWPHLCFLAMCDDRCVGAIVCKLDYHKKISKRGYIAMLAVDQNYR